MIQVRFDDLRPTRRRSFRLDDLVEVVTATRVDQVPEVLRRVEEAVTAGQWVAGWVSYEAAPAFDAKMPVSNPLEGLPLAWFAVFESRCPVADEETAGYVLGAWKPTVLEPGHADAVAAIRQHIRRGRSYQVNHTFRLSASFTGDAAALYRDLTHSQNAGYGALIDTGEWVVASASPELFFEWEGGVITSRPMKGTARRGIDLDDDEERRQGLAGSEKNRAENLMIVDMVRNDLGRVAQTGTIEVPELFATEKYDTVWQLTSTVTARPRPGVTLYEVFAAMFPSASITGAPKISTMGIIRSLEPDPRGVYCGAVGFGGPDPEGRPGWAFNVAIRTVTVDRATATAWYGTGGGITYDSTAEEEYAEAILKAEVLERRTADFELLETLRVEPRSGIRLLSRHLDRLCRSARYFDIPLDITELREAIAIERSPDTPIRLRVLVGRTGAIRIHTSPLGEEAAARPVLAIERRPVDPGDPFLHHKTTLRQVYRQAAARHPDADDVVLVNPAGEVTETTIANLAVLIDGEWRTPPTSAGCLGGVRRAELLDRRQIVERSVSVAELRSADAIARFNAVRPWEECELA